MSRIIFIFLIVFVSCQGEKNTFTEEENKIIDSLYRIRVKELGPGLDSVCDSVYNLKFPIYVDSIKQVRQKEIIDLIQK